MKNKVINFLEMYKGTLNLLDNMNSSNVYNIDINKNGHFLTIEIKNSPYFYSNNDNNFEFKITEDFTNEEMRLIINTIRNMFIEERKIHKPFIDFKRGEEIIENSKFHLITHFDKESKLELEDTMYYHEVAVAKYESDNFALSLKK